MSLDNVCLLVVSPRSDSSSSPLPETARRYLKAFEGLPNKFTIDSNAQGDLITTLNELSTQFAKALVVLLGPTSFLPPLALPAISVGGKKYPAVALHQVCKQFSALAVTIVDRLDFKDARPDEQPSFSKQDLIELFGQSGNLLICSDTTGTDSESPFSTLLLQTMAENGTGFMPSVIKLYQQHNLEIKPVMRGCLITQAMRGPPLPMHTVK